MFYLCLAITVSWLIYFGYLLYLGRELLRVKKRLEGCVK